MKLLHSQYVINLVLYNILHIHIITLCNNHTSADDEKYAKQFLDQV